MANNINETSFLESQRARTENLGGHRREKTERLHAFWASLKKYLSAWNERLQELDTGQASPLSLTDEADKRRVHLKLSELADELKELRKTCLSSTTTPTAIVVQATENINAASRAQRELLSMIVPPPADELPATDLRLLHRDFSQCQTNLDACRNRLLPKGKFVFGRYRQALLQKQVAAALLEGHETTTHKRRGTTSACGPDTCSPAATDSVARMKEAVENLKTTLQDLVNVRAVVHADGRVEITSKATLDLDKDDSSLAGRQGRIVHQLGDGTGQLVVRNLRDCTVTLLGNYKALHIVNVEQSTIAVLARIDGAVHVTRCRHSTIALQSQQLRLHESSDLQCRVAVSAGAILEECTGITFVTSSPLLFDVKDFDWLRSRVPSPNYTVEISDKEVDAEAVVVNAFETSEKSEKDYAHMHEVNLNECSAVTPFGTPDNESDEDEL